MKSLYKLWTPAWLCMLLAVVANARAAEPQDLMLVLDNSGSMRKVDPSFLVRDAVRSFIVGVPDGQRAGVIIFDQSVRLAVPLTELSAATRPGLLASLDAIDYRGKFTDSPSAFERAIYELKTNARPDAQKIVVFMTDGIVDTGDERRDAERGTWLREALAADAAANGVRIFGVAFTEGADFLMIQTLATRTGGDYLRAPHATDLADAFARLGERLRTTPAPAAATRPASEPGAVAEPPLAEGEPTATAPLPTPAIEAAPGPSAAPATEPSADVVAPATGTESAAAGPAATGDGTPELTAGERASLEQLAKETGIPVAQLLQEMEGGSPGQAVVVHPGEAPAAAKVPPLALLLALGALVAAVLGWLMLRGRAKRKPASGVTNPRATAPLAVPAGPSQPDASLIDIHGLTSEAARRLGDKPMMVGRIAGSDPDYLDYFVVNKATVGRRHAVIKYRDHGYWIVDQGSVNGTFVNNERVLGERHLKHGDRIKFHKFEFEFSQPDMAGSATVIQTPPPDQTIVAGTDSTLTATAASLRGTHAGPAIAAAAAVGGAAGAFAGRGAPSRLDPNDVTADGDIDAIAEEREAFFSSSGAQDAVLARGGHHDFGAPPGTPDAGDITHELPRTTIERALAAGLPAAGEGDDDLGAEINPDAIREANNLRHEDTSEYRRDIDFDEQASAFFDDVTVGHPDVHAEPHGNDDLDILDITAVRVSGVGDDDPTTNHVPPGTVLDGAAGERIGSHTLGNTTFSEMTTVYRNDPGSDEPDASLDDFLEAAGLAAPAAIPQDDPDTTPFVRTDPFGGGQAGAEGTEVLRAVPEDDIFDVTGTDDPSYAHSTLVMPDSPRAKAGTPAPDAAPAPRDAKP